MGESEKVFYRGKCAGNVLSPAILSRLLRLSVSRPGRPTDVQTRKTGRRADGADAQNAQTVQTCRRADAQNAHRLRCCSLFRVPIRRLTPGPQRPFDCLVIDEPDYVGRARSGDLAAFNALVLEHQSLVYAVCLRQLGQPGSAEDAAQEAFISAWKNLGSLRGPFRPWLLRIAVNACTDELRRRGRRPASSLEMAMEEGAPDPPDPGPLPESAALSAEMQGRIGRALQLLVPEQRMAVHLRDVEGLGYAEIAAAMKTSVGTVKSRISRGRTELRRLLLQEPELLPAWARLNNEGAE